MSKSFVGGNRTFSSLSGKSSFGPAKPIADSEHSHIESVVIAIKEGDLQKLQTIIEKFTSTLILDPKKESFLEFINQLDDRNWNFIHHACFFRQSAVVQFFINLGCDINRVTLDQYTPLQLSCMQNSLECVKILISNSSLQINKMTNRGTALHIACRYNNEKVVELLLENGAHTGLEDVNGLTPILLTQKMEILELLPKYTGKELISKYCKSLELPLSFSGMVYWSSPFKINETQIFLLLNSAAEHIYHYSKRSDFENNFHPAISIRIKDIEDVQITEEKILESKYFMVIKTRLESYWYYTKYPDMTSAWVQRIIDAVKYFQISEQSGKINTPAFFIPDDNAEVLETSVCVDSFRISKEVGVGSFGKVYEAFKKDSNERFAIKVLSKSILRRHNQLKYAIAECKILKEIRHPFIIPLHWAFQSPKNLYIVYEFCPYGDLSGILKQKMKLSEPEAKLYISETILAIEYLHSLDIVYRDFKPLNILLDLNGHVKLSDFGLAKSNVSKDNPAMSFCGSPAYLAPELLKMSGAHKPVDIYAIGVTLYELLTGSLPFANDNLSRLYKQISIGKLKFPPECSKQAKTLIKSMMTVDPNKRPTISQVKNFEFFEGVDWDGLLNTCLPSPYKPQTELHQSTDILYSQTLSGLDLSNLAELSLIEGN